MGGREEEQTMAFGNGAETLCVIKQTVRSVLYTRRLCRSEEQAFGVE